MRGDTWVFMQTSSERPTTSAGVSRPASWLEEFCLPFLLKAQHPDGGWGHRVGSQSSAEPTCWALLALGGAPTSRERENAIRRGIAWLSGTQLANGSWPAYPSTREGCWVTSLACLAVYAQARQPEVLTKGLVWLCDTWPGEGGFWWRLRERLSRTHSVSRQNSFFRGWSWTPGTSSWVEPTSYALIALRKIPQELHPRSAPKRLSLGEGMLYDRICPGGGWNCGNPLVYGVPGEPAVGPTVWALLALQGYAERSENQFSLDWLERIYPGIRGPSSLILANLCLRIYGRSVPPLEPALEHFYDTNQFCQNIAVAAWAAMALSPAGDWLRCRPGRHG